MLKCLKKLFDIKPKHKNVSNKKVIGDINGVHLTSSIYVREPSEKEILIRELGKTATQLKKTDINEAIACLQQMNSLLDESSTQYSIETYLRLPLFLQQAGRMDEAEVIFEGLYKSKSDAANKAIIKEKWELARKRNNRKHQNIAQTSKT